MRPECHHPPFVIQVSGDVSLADLEKFVARAVEHHTRPIAVRGGTITVSVVECSWCRKGSGTRERGSKGTYTQGTSLPAIKGP